MLKLKQPLYVLSKKYYAGGEVTIEFAVRDNSKISATLLLTLKKDNEGMAEFELGREYLVEFVPYVVTGRKEP